MVKAMDESDRQKTAAPHSVNILDSIFEEFGEINFYGVETIVEELAQSRAARPPQSGRAAVDWFGLEDWQP